MSEPMIAARNARVDVEGVPAIDGLSLETTGTHVLVLGAARALFEAACGMRPVARGDIAIDGARAQDALTAGRVAGAPLDPPLPPTWSAGTYIEWNARLAGNGRGASRSLAKDAIERMRMGAIAGATPGKAAPHARRAAVIAGAIASGARVVLLEDPLASLPEDTARNLGRVLAQALADRAWALFAPRVSLSSPLAASADEALVIVGSEVAAQGSPASLAGRERAYAVKVHGSLDALASLAEARGAKVARGQAELTIDLGEGLSTRDLLRMASEANAVIVELRPVAGAFA